MAQAPSSRIQVLFFLGCLLLPLAECGAQLRSAGYFVTGHSSDIKEARSVAFSADAELLAVADAGTWGTTAEVYESLTGRQVAKLTVHPSRIRVITFNSDSTRLITGLADGRIIFWATDDWRQVGSLQAHKAPVNCLDLTSDGGCLASGAEDGTISVIDPKTTVIKYQLAGHQTAVLSIGLSSNGTSAVSAGTDGIIAWDLASGSKRVVSQEASSNGCRSIAVLSDVGVIAGALFGSGDIRLWDMNSGDSVGVLSGHEDDVTQLKLAVNCGQLVSGSVDGSVRIWSIKDRRCLSASSAAGGSVQSVAISKDASVVAAGTVNGSVAILQNGTPRGYLRTNQYAASGLSLGHDGSLLSACSGSPESMKEEYAEFAFGVDTRTTFIRQDGITSVSLCEYSRDGQLRVLAGGQYVLIQSKAEDDTWQEAHRVAVENKVECLGLSSDGMMMMTLGNRTLAFWETGTGRLRSSVRPREVKQACLSDDGRVAAFADSKQFFILSTEDGEILWTQAVEAIDTKGRPALGSFEEMCFSSSGQLVIRVCDSLQVWDLTTRKLIASRAHDHQCHYDSLVALSQNRLAVIANKDIDPGARNERGYVIELISVPEGPGRLQTLVETVIPKSEESGSLQLFASADGSRLASSQRNFIRLWSLDAQEKFESTTAISELRFDAGKQAQLKSSIQALKDPLIDELTRRRICKQIQALGAECASSIEELVAVLGNGEGDSKYLLLQILGECGPEAVDVLVDFVECKDRTLNGVAVSKLRRIGPGAKKGWDRLRLLIEADYRELTTKQLSQREYDWRRSRLESCLRMPVDLGVPAENAISLLSQIANPAHSMRVKRDLSPTYAVAVAEVSMKEIAKYGELAGAAVPTLSKLAEECMSQVPPRDYLHQEALVTLAAIGPEAKAAEPMLNAILASQSPAAVTCRERAKAVLRRIDKH